MKDGLADNQVINIQEDDLGNIWFGTGAFGISEFDGNKITTHTNKVNITKGTVLNWKSKTMIYGFSLVVACSDIAILHLTIYHFIRQVQRHKPKLRFRLVAMAFIVS